MFRDRFDTFKLYREEFRANSRDVASKLPILCAPNAMDAPPKGKKGRIKAKCPKCGEKHSKVFRTNKCFKCRLCSTLVCTKCTAKSGNWFVYDEDEEYMDFSNMQEGYYFCETCADDVTTYNKQQLGKQSLLNTRDEDMMVFATEIDMLDLEVDGLLEDAHVLLTDGVLSDEKVILPAKSQSIGFKIGLFEPNMVPASQSVLFYGSRYSMCTIVTAVNFPFLKTKVQVGDIVVAINDIAFPAPRDAKQILKKLIKRKRKIQLRFRRHESPKINQLENINHSVIDILTRVKKHIQKIDDLSEFSEFEQTLKKRFRWRLQSLTQEALPALRGVQGEINTLRDELEMELQKKELQGFGHNDDNNNNNSNNDSGANDNDDNLDDDDDVDLSSNSSEIDLELSSEDEEDNNINSDEEEEEEDCSNNNENGNNDGSEDNKISIEQSPLVQRQSSMDLQDVNNNEAVSSTTTTTNKLQVQLGNHFANMLLSSDDDSKKQEAVESDCNPSVTLNQANEKRHLNNLNIDVGDGDDDEGDDETDDILYENGEDHIPLSGLSPGVHRRVVSNHSLASPAHKHAGVPNRFRAQNPVFVDSNGQVSPRKALHRVQARRHSLGAETPEVEAALSSITPSNTNTNTKPKMNVQQDLPQSSQPPIVPSPKKSSMSPPAIPVSPLLSEPTNQSANGTPLNRKGRRFGIFRRVRKLSNPSTPSFLAEKSNTSNDLPPISPSKPIIPSTPVRNGQLTPNTPNAPVSVNTPSRVPKSAAKPSSTSKPSPRPNIKRTPSKQLAQEMMANRKNHYRGSNYSRNTRDNRSAFRREMSARFDVVSQIRRPTPLNTNISMSNTTTAQARQKPLKTPKIPSFEKPKGPKMVIESEYPTLKPEDFTKAKNAHHNSEMPSVTPITPQNIKTPKNKKQQVKAKQQASTTIRKYPKSTPENEPQTHHVKQKLEIGQKRPYPSTNTTPKTPSPQGTSTPTRNPHTPRRLQVPTSQVPNVDVEIKIPAKGSREALGGVRNAFVIYKFMIFEYMHCTDIQPAFKKVGLKICE
eukprot:TRINITY_DN1938_c4_g1_i1.p1 TRINITY_DN1938_c4_g1~~TRINITY_DN1938_c4_g1_i1.p1  ORF type:complete len:1039 (+),score=358.48 TRINITY_DN1938_c4_g1_i1:129-3245(+)